MILVVGGIASGRREFAASLGYGDSDCSQELASAAKVLVDAENLVRDGHEAPAEIAERIASSKEVVICTDVGSGIVPIDRSEREWRDRAGTLSKELAARADAVIRMTCGIPQAVKGDLPAMHDESDAARCGAKEQGAPMAQGGTGPQATPKASSFFTNRSCEYFPCHEGVDESEFNCMFCYCPLYTLGPECGGNFSYTERGRKNCKNCAIPHVGDAGAKLVAARYGDLADLASRA